jgi:hypothetical protein
MAQDIHCFVEYRLNWSSGEPFWNSLSAGPIDLCAGRWVVAALSNVRGNALIAARGFPADASIAACAVYFEPDPDRPQPSYTDRPRDQYWNPGWLTRQEVEDALALYEPEPNILPPVRAVVAAMRALESDLGPEAVRLVFWLC